MLIFSPRHMVASRDVRAGEVIFEEMPLTFGPSDNSQPVCLGGYQVWSLKRKF